MLNATPAGLAEQAAGGGGKKPPKKPPKQEENRSCQNRAGKPAQGGEKGAGGGKEEQPTDSRSGGRVSRDERGSVKRHPTRALAHGAVRLCLSGDATLVTRFQTLCSLQEPVRLSPAVPLAGQRGRVSGGRCLTQRRQASQRGVAAAAVRSLPKRGKTARNEPGGCTMHITRC